MYGLLPRPPPPRATVEYKSLTAQPAVRFQVAPVAWCRGQAWEGRLKAADDDDDPLLVWLDFLGWSDMVDD